MSPSDGSGYRHLPAPYDVRRWQHRLFVEVRKAPDYRRLRDEVRAAWDAAGQTGAPPESLREGFWFGDDLDPNTPYITALSRAVTALGLTNRDQASPWAVWYLHEDICGQFREDAVPPLIAPLRLVSSRSRSVRREGASRRSRTQDRDTTLSTSPRVTPRR
jgi:hypothetical protein